MTYYSFELILRQTLDDVWILEIAFANRWFRLSFTITENRSFRLCLSVGMPRSGCGGACAVLWNPHGISTSHDHSFLSAVNKITILTVGLNSESYMQNCICFISATRISWFTLRPTSGGNRKHLSQILHGKHFCNFSFWNRLSGFSSQKLLPSFCRFFYLMFSSPPERLCNFLKQHFFD
jgi:hypothetical protein